MPAWSPLTAFLDRSCSWRVQVLDAADDVLSTSPIRAITKDATLPTVTAITPETALPITGPIAATFGERVPA